VIYRLDAANAEADCLSRNLVLENEIETNQDDPIRTVNTITIGEIKEGQKDVIRQKNDREENGVILRKIGKHERIVSNAEVGRRLIRETHLKFGHIGTQQLSEFLKTKYYFRNMYKEIRDFCGLCEVCIKNESRQGSRLGLMGHLGPASEPF